MISISSPAALRIASTQRAACFNTCGLSISSDTGIGIAFTAVKPRSTLSRIRSAKFSGSTVLYMPSSDPPPR